MKTLAFTAALLIAFTFNSVANDRNNKEVSKESSIAYPIVDVLAADVNTKDVETLKFHVFLSGPAMEIGTPLDVLNNKSVEALRTVSTNVQFPAMEWGSAEEVANVFANTNKNQVKYPAMVYGSAADIDTVEIAALIK